MSLALFLLLALLSLAYACELPHHHSSNTTSTLTKKRWYSVDHLREDTQLLPGPWPAVDDAGSTPIRFCFEDEASYKTLHDLIRDAVQLWAPASAVSTLTIEPDCGADEWHCICSKRTHWDVLAIVDVTDDEYGKTAATQGHTYVESQERERNEEGRFVYHILGVRRDEEKMGFSRSWDVCGIAHELGHVAGLDHEHQRPDAAKEGFRWSCGMLEDADSVHHRIADRDPEAYEEGDTFEKACGDLAVARRYGFSATALIPKPAHVLGANVWSQDLDWNSISKFCPFSLIQPTLTNFFQ
ncbi:uncharacterized protein MYCFIDRAFT_79480 [Pseudocercospora fijiensis CIRAD86]|uniref:Metalloendopeptidase n=1 Tax=Pseudocercospora fijiensis (strain CIRAD86) TaxID=383855 RepID=M3AQS3_PSEFD|nr:uncharacterized protein MYCFIDRAFT_79480 [Pseudocercospora fijiensis CIRAD86]EME79448.1 hypothetical protein MYCFIDRAFT_79480 [Pseudocercospora fijiensis CIRAD86]